MPMKDFLFEVQYTVSAVWEQIKEFDYMWTATTFLSGLTFEDFIKIIIIYLLLLWASIVVWVTKDIINRTNNIFLQIFAILTVLIWTPLWIIVYFLIRPSQTIFERHYEEYDYSDDDSYAEGLLKEIEKIVNQNAFTSKCRSCKYPVKKEYKYCPSCRIELIKSCISCKKAINEKWDYCPHCGQDQEQKISKILSVPSFDKVFNKTSHEKNTKSEEENKELSTKVENAPKKDYKPNQDNKTKKKP